ncbi:AraC family transcriptional regulator [Allonocardiopsis opalescens]|uniref:AraC family transcriptional regulator n=1 Tax=Allonocardiopsis opalescens TaxID=1144618 RepID=UPI000D0673AF|nr:AraC family transcriptional regulator [Allonocardiopsis opalescens]
MDVLSDVIAVMRTGRPRSARLSWHAPWGRWFAAVPGAGFHVVLQGACWLTPPEGEQVRLGTGDVVFFPHGREHALADGPTSAITAPDCDPDDPHAAGLRTAAAGDQAGDGAPAAITLCGAYRLDPARAHPLLAGLPEVVHLSARGGQSPELRSAVALLGVELDRPRLGTDAIVPALLDMMLLYILRAWFDGQAVGASRGWAAALSDPPVAAALHSIHRDPARLWTVAALAAEAGLSRASFARRFAALVGRPPLTYLTWWRMTTAARLLRESTAPLHVIAARVGYTSEFAFANAFKRVYGTAPGRYRRAAQGGARRASP